MNTRTNVQVFLNKMTKTDKTEQNCTAKEQLMCRDIISLVSSQRCSFSVPFVPFVLQCTSVPQQNDEDREA